MSESDAIKLALSPGTHLGRYELHSQLGKGGMGEVYLARDKDLGRTVALKFLHADMASDDVRMQRFIQEAKIVSSLNHPNILTIYEIGEVKGTYFIATEYIDGVTLRHLISKAPLEIKEVVDIAIQITAALVAAHSTGIIHRDIKPENIMLRRDGYVKVLDFGLAKLNEQRQPLMLKPEQMITTEPGLLLGTLNYMSPEQARGLRVDERTDIFSLGIMLYEMIAGHAPFSGLTTSDILVSILEREPPALSQVPPMVQESISKALAKHKEDRYQSAAEMASVLRHIKQYLDFGSEWNHPASEAKTSPGLPNLLASSRDAASSPSATKSSLPTQIVDLDSSAPATPDIAHVLFMDIVGYSKKATSFQRQLLHHLNIIVRETDAFRHAQAQGQLVSRATGDGMALVFFGDPEAPVRCAIQISRALKGYSEIEMRMGIHSGIVYRNINIAGERDVAGRGINIAQRVMNCGDAGHILLSKEMADYLLEIGQWEDSLHDLGIATVKHGAPVHIFNLYREDVGNPEVPAKMALQKKGKRQVKRAEPEAGERKKRTAKESGPIRKRERKSVASGFIDSLAILPMTNASADPNMEYLSDGITESIINTLSQLPQLRVMARSTVFRYKGRDIDPQDAGRELGVRAVMNGRVLYINNILIIKVELVNVADGSAIWGDEYKEKLEDIFELQDKISKEISERLRLKLTGEEKQLLKRRYTDDVEAYQLYLKGRYFWSKRTREGLRKGSEHFKQAIDMDPSYALAYAGLADAYAFLGLHRVIPPHDILPQAKAAATKALEIDKDLAEGHSALAYIKTIYDWDWKGAEQGFTRSIALNPGDASTHSYYANYLSAMSRHDEAMEEIRCAQRIDPLSPIINVMVGYMAFLKRDYDLTIEQCQKTREIEPDFFWSYMGLGWSYEEQGMVDRAIPEFEKAVELTDGTVGTLAGLGHAYGLAGRKREALEIIGRLQDQSKQNYVVPYDIAQVYAGLNDNDEALAWLEKAFQARFGWLIWINVEPKWDFLRSDPRFQYLLRRIGLEPQVKISSDAYEKV